MTDGKLISLVMRFSTMANLMVTFISRSSDGMTLNYDLGGHFEFAKIT